MMDGSSWRGCRNGQRASYLVQPGSAWACAHKIVAEAHGAPTSEPRGLILRHQFHCERFRDRQDRRIPRGAAVTARTHHGAGSEERRRILRIARRDPTVATTSTSAMGIQSWFAPRDVFAGSSTLATRRASGSAARRGTSTALAGSGAVAVVLAIGLAVGSAALVPTG